jgi:hypothetical protein
LRMQAFAIADRGSHAGAHVCTNARSDVYTVADFVAHARAGLVIANDAFTDNIVPDYIQSDHAKPLNAFAHNAIADCNANNSNSCTV